MVSVHVHLVILQILDKNPENPYLCGIIQIKIV